MESTARESAQQPDFEPLPPIAQSLPVRLMRARESVMGRIRPILRAHGVTEQQWRVLMTVRDLEETEVTALAEHVFLLPPSLSRILRDLEGRGFMVRRSSAQDQRRALVSLTRAGQAFIRQAEPELSAVRLEIRDLLGAEWLRALASMLDHLESKLGAPAPAQDND